ncbi:uncharacterized protein LOC132276140 [Cornus florida]|uniref:uncharacterized protein LOC132276140 n=1 Tax=Cornus florida TaxID=4283 RepID=UPI00289F8EAC|nr:uncharacterized protein LOC132276140 [Cornus florida]
MRWHKEKCVKETNVLKHPADSRAWEEFDNQHGWFVKDPRNIRLGLGTDGFNPFGNMNNAYSVWPVFIVAYNAAPWKLMRDPYVFMPLLIPSPKSPGKDIDVYLRPLIDELKELWVDGVSTFDSYTRRKFKLHAVCLWTLNDLPALADLSDLDHDWWNRSKQFDGYKEHRLPPKELSGDEILEKLEQLDHIRDVNFGKRLLPVGIRGCLYHDICNALAKLGIFFEELCYRTLKVEVLEALERDIALILCKLEMIFPPTFFDIMVHLAVHLPQEALIAGPVQYRWMYPIERFLCTLKSYVHNKARPEGSIAEAYVDSECITFCSLYLSGVETRFNREERNYEGDQTVQGASLYIKQMRQLKDSSINDDTFSLACGPERRVKRYSGCIVNGSRFHTKDREQNRKTQNSGISVKCEGVEYYGVLIDVIELKYILGGKVFIFKCDWRDVTTKLGIHKDPHFTSVNVSRQLYEDQPFVLPQQVQQVFYMKDTKLRGLWEVVQKITCRRIFDVSVVEDGKGDEEEDESNTENDAYQEFEPCIVDGVVQDCPNINQLSLNRDNIPSDQIDVEVVHKCRQDTHVVDNEDVELFDSTTNEEYTLLTDDDTDESDWEEG